MKPVKGVNELLTDHIPEGGIPPWGTVWWWWGGGVLERYQVIRGKYHFRLQSSPVYLSLLVLKLASVFKSLSLFSAFLSIFIDVLFPWKPSLDSVV